MLQLLREMEYRDAWRDVDSLPATGNIGTLQTC